MDLQYFKKTGLMRITEEDIQDPGTRKVIENILEKQQHQWIQECDEVETIYGVSPLWAACIWYLRQRRRWTQELEDRLVEMAHNGENSPNMFEWPPEPEHWL